MEDPAWDGANWYINVANNLVKYVDPPGFATYLDSEGKTVKIKDDGNLGVYQWVGDDPTPGVGDTGSDKDFLVGEGLFWKHIDDTENWDENLAGAEEVLQ